MGQKLIEVLLHGLQKMLPSKKYKVVIYADRVPHREHERVYKQPAINEVVALVIGNEYSSRDIVLQLRSNNIVYIFM